MFCSENLWQLHIFDIFHGSFWWNEHHFTSIRLVQAIMLTIFIQKVSRFNLKRYTAHPDGFSWFFSVPLRSCQKTALNYAGFEILVTVFMRSSIFCDTTLCIPLKVNRRLGACRLLIQGRRISHTRNQNGADSKQGNFENDDYNSH
jgi:hypothetical protein